MDPSNPFESWVSAHAPAWIVSAVGTLLTIVGLLLRRELRNHDKKHEAIDAKAVEVASDIEKLQLDAQHFVTRNDLDEKFEELRESQISSNKNGYEMVAKIFTDRMSGIESTQTTILQELLRRGSR